MNLRKNEISHLLLAAVVTAGVCTGCWDDNESETVVNDYHNALITSVTLGTNTNVCSSLSSYSFTIDHLGASDPELIDRTRQLWEDDADDDAYNVLAPGIIFNPDSLPLGSIPDSIKVTLSYSSPSAVMVYQYDDSLELQNCTNYADTQTIWFDDYAVTRIEVTAYDGFTKKNYFMKVNVHQVLTDTIAWHYAAQDLFDMTDVADQRVDTIADSLYWYTSMTDGSQYVRTSCLSGDVSEWSAATAVSAPATVDLGSLLNWRNSLYAVGSNGALLCSTDGKVWTNASSDFTFVNVLGIQLAGRKSGAEHLCAIVDYTDTLQFAASTDGMTWKLDTLVVDGVSTSIVPVTFPIHGYSRPIAVAANPTKGSSCSRLNVTGGVMADGNLTAATWICDGTQWAEFTQGSLPKQQGATIVRYTLDVDKPDSFWILHVGQQDNGLGSDTLYYSENYGVSWRNLEYDYLQYADLFDIETFAGGSAFYNPADYTIYVMGGTNRKGNQVSHVVAGQLVSLCTRQRR